MLKKISSLMLIVITAMFVVACSPKKSNPNVVVVATISGPETQLMEVAKVVAMNRYRLDVQIIPFSDYNAPNLALASGAVDANAFQHKPFLDEQIKMQHFNLVAIGNTFIYPMGVYSHKIKSLSELKMGDTCEKGSQLRPHIVWFGEAVPNIIQAVSLCREADIFMVIGTSMQVYPAAGLIDYVPAKVPKYLVDPGASSSYRIPNLTIFQENAGACVPGLVEKLLLEPLSLTSLQ